MDCYRLLHTLEAWVTGYRSEHYKLGLQQAICFALALLPIVVNKLYLTLDRGGSSLYTAITVAVVLEPSTGDSFRMLFMRILAAGMSGGIGVLILYMAVGNNAYNYDQFREEIGAWVITSLGILGFVFMTNRQRYFKHHAFWNVALLTLPIVTVPAIRADSSLFYTGAVFRMVNVLDGILVAAVVSFVVFPVRARGLLERKMASTMVQIGDLAVWLVGQACTPPAPGTPGRLPGASGTDGKHLYVDDGLRKKLQPLMATAASLTADLAYMGKLLAAARTELYVIKKPHRFPAQQYQRLLDSCHVVLGIFLSLLYSMESGEVSLECCQRHIGDLSETGVRLSAAFTALSSIIRPPKVKKGKKKKKKKQQQQQQRRARDKEQQQQQQQQEEHRAAATNGAAAAASHGAAAAGGEGLAPRPSPMPPLLDLERAETMDDPFAGLQDARTASGNVFGARPGVVALSPSQLRSAQQLARRMSQVMERRAAAFARGASLAVDVQELEILEVEEEQYGSSGSEGEGDGERGVGRAHGQPSLASGAASGSSSSAAAGTSGQPTGEPAGPPGTLPKASMGAASLGTMFRSDAERREWVMLKLRALIDSMCELEGAAYQERQQNAHADGLAAFMLVVHACVNLTRQCGACFTALDPERGGLLHEYWQARRKPGMLLHS